MQFTYSPWRHGGWYVYEVRYPSGAVGCVSRNYPDRKWRIVCHPLPFEQQPTFKSRDEAAGAEHALALSLQRYRVGGSRRKFTFVEAAKRAGKVFEKTGVVVAIVKA